MKSGKSVSKGTASERYIAMLLVFCLALVGIWEVMSSRSERPWDAFQVGAAAFQGFRFKCDGWNVEQKKISPSPIDPEILKYDLVPEDRGRKTEDRGQSTTLRQSSGPSADYAGVAVRVRLAHGYNMVDCMKIKGYAVKLLLDGKALGTRHLAIGFPGRVQIWELENSVGDKSIWVTSMLRAGDLSVLDIPTTDMAFPRVGVPDNPDWLPQGLTLNSLRHPIRNWKICLRAKWNKSRNDPWVFLKLKQPIWADDESLTLVTNTKGRGPADKSEEEEYVGMALEAHGLLYRELVEWKKLSAE